MWRRLAGLLVVLLGMQIFPRPVLAQAAQVGQGAPNPQLFLDAYNRRGGQPNLGLPISPAHRWGPGWAQDFRGGRAGDTAILLADGAGAAFVLHGEIWKKYRDGGGVDRCGYPTSDEMGGLSSRGTSFAFVTAPQCLIYYVMGGPATGRTVWVWGLVGSKYRMLGAHSGVLGVPIADEQDGPSSPYGTAGRFQRFENGSIEFTRNGQRPMTPFFVRGDTFQKYSESGYSGGWLGWPIGDEAPSGGGARQEFEGGYITWDPANRAVAVRRGQEAERPRLPVIGPAPEERPRLPIIEPAPAPGVGDPCGAYYNRGYCTDYIRTRVHIPWRGNAIAWFDSARDHGWRTEREPRVGTIAVFRSPPGVGHVAWVEAVSPDRQRFVVSQWNYARELRPGTPRQCWVTVNFGATTTTEWRTGDPRILGFVYPR